MLGTSNCHQTRLAISSNVSFVNSGISIIFFFGQYCRRSFQITLLRIIYLVAAVQQVDLPILLLNVLIDQIKVVTMLQVN